MKYLSLYNNFELITESRIMLSDSERKQIERLIPEIIKKLESDDIVVSQRTNKKKLKPMKKGFNIYVWQPSNRHPNNIVGKIEYKLADGTPAAATIIVDDDAPHCNAYFEPNDKDNHSDNEIVIQQKMLKKMLDYLKPEKTFGTGVGVLKKQWLREIIDIDFVKERIRSILTHELIHAKDPGCNHHVYVEPYEETSTDFYFKSSKELVALSSEFFEGLTVAVESALKRSSSKKNKLDIIKCLDDILEYYSGKKSSLDESTLKFMKMSGVKSVFTLTQLAKSVVILVNNLLTEPIKEPSQMNKYQYFISEIKKSNPDGYKVFLKNLWKTISELKQKTIE